MEDIIGYFTDIFHLDKHAPLPEGIVNKLNALDRVQRGELKSRLFIEAKRLGVGGDGIRAIRWLESTFEQIEKNSFRLHEVLFSPGQDIPENLAFYMSQAKTSIDLCVFTISDDVLSDCLKKLHERGIKIRIITDNNKMRDAGSQIKELARCGIDVKVDNSRYHMHNKFGIIDGRIAFTGSYNWTYTAKMHNQENLLLTTNFTIVHKFINEFETLWEQMFWLKVKQSRDGQTHASVKLSPEEAAKAHTRENSEKRRDQRRMRNRQKEGNRRTDEAETSNDMVDDYASKSIDNRSNQQRRKKRSRGRRQPYNKAEETSNATPLQTTTEPEAVKKQLPLWKRVLRIK